MLQSVLIVPIIDPSYIGYIFHYCPTLLVNTKKLAKLAFANTVKYCPKPLDLLPDLAVFHSISLLLSLYGYSFTTTEGLQGKTVCREQIFSPQQPCLDFNIKKVY